MSADKSKLNEFAQRMNWSEQDVLDFFKEVEGRVHGLSIEQMQNNQGYDEKVGADHNLEMRITQILLEIEVPSDILGFRYLRESIKLVLEDFTCIDSMCGRLYIDVAGIYGTTKGRVERAMRHAIEVAWDRVSVVTMKKYFGVVRNKPTNGEFIATIADYLRLEGTGK